MTTTYFIVLGTPITQGSMKSIGRGRMIHQNSKKLNLWRAEIAKQFEKKRPADWRTDGEYSVYCKFYFKPPKKPSHSYPVKDLDKLIRAVNDALTGHAWDDDSQVIRIECEKEYSENDAVEILIREKEMIEC